MAVVMRDIRAVFCAGHRVLGPHACNVIHGHSYSVKVRICSRVLDSAVDGVGEVPGTPFASALQAYCDSHLDHAFLINADDDTFGTTAEPVAKFVVMPYNPTLENIARYFGSVVVPFLPFASTSQVVSVTVEDERNSVVWINEDMSE